MRKLLALSVASGALALCFAVTTAQALPALGSKPTATTSASDVQKIDWRRVCNSRGYDCHRVWVGRDRDDRRDRDRRDRDRDRDRRDRDRR